MESLVNVLLTLKDLDSFYDASLHTLAYYTCYSPGLLLIIIQHLIPDNTSQLIVISCIGTYYYTFVSLKVTTVHVNIACFIIHSVVTKYRQNVFIYNVCYGNDKCLSKVHHNSADADIS